ncbi:MAG: hypothetical protein ACLTV1_05795 [Christensenellales bacterium]
MGGGCLSHSQKDTVAISVVWPIAEMIRWAGLGCAQWITMEVKEAADLVIPSCAASRFVHHRKCIINGKVWLYGGRYGGKR